MANNIFIEFLPPWIETGVQPAFYDKESGSVLQQTARMYAKVNETVAGVDHLNDAVNDYIEQFNELHDYVDDYFDNLDVQQEINNKLLINYDCVSDGDNILLVLNKATRKYFEQPVKDVFKSNGDKIVHIHSSSTTFYPSDQIGFPINIAVSALKKNRILGLYMNRIHTSRDTVFDERNIEFISNKTKQLIEKIS
jgi:hypothetical protein